MTDQLLVAISKDGTLRARAARTSATVSDALIRHLPVPSAAHALARALSCAAVFPMEWKHNERVSLQWQGDGPLHMILAEFRRPGLLRGLVPPAASGNLVAGEDGQRPSIASAVGIGQLSVILQGPTGAFARGQVALTSSEIDQDFETYFNMSVQIPTRVATHVALGENLLSAETSALLVQTLPGGDADQLPDTDALRQRPPAEDPRSLLDAAFGPDGYDVLETIDLGFDCPCSLERVRAGVMLLAPGRARGHDRHRQEGGGPLRVLPRPVPARRGRPPRDPRREAPPDRRLNRSPREGASRGRPLRRTE
jgi:molecular chaperone Hsp33